jgi:SAM-dependent methyltransferase
MSRTAFAAARVLPLMLLAIAPSACESRTDRTPDAAAPAAPPAVTRPAAPAPAELLTDAPPATATAATTTEVPAKPPEAAATAPASRPAAEAYEFRPGSRDGTGKWYMGREIAHVVSGHATVNWLERAEREAEERPSRLIAILAKRIQRDDVVADLGAGSGYYSFRLAPLVPEGKVLAVDIQREMLDIIEQAARDRKVDNVRTVLGTTKTPNLPEGGVDYVLLVDAYHEFDHPREMMLAVRNALRPGGRVILIEFRGEDANVPIKPLHKMTEAQAKREFHAAGLRHVETLNDLPWQHVMFFERPAE